MRGRSWGISKSVLACLAILGGAGMGGLAAGYNARAGLSAASSTVVAAVADVAPADLARADSVNLRFPADWADAAVEPVSQMVALASADSSIALFSPRPTYAATDADAPVMVEATPKPAAPAAPAKVALASAVAKPPVKPRSNHVLNDSQIASIKKRLNLTPEQQRYWPAVEAELRKMEYNKKSTHGADRHEQGQCRGTQIRWLPAGHELQRRPAAGAQIARPPFGPRECHGGPLSTACITSEPRPADAPGFLLPRRWLHDGGP